MLQNFYAKIREVKLKVEEERRGLLYVSKILFRKFPGNPIERPGELNDHLLSPYPNAAAAKAANGGVFPPDLSMLLLTREAAEDYVFALLTSYCDPPAGVKV